jgi:hypothetical protein
MVDIKPIDYISYNKWDNTQKESFIESVMLNFPLGVLVFNSSTISSSLMDCHIIDGHERLNTISDFILNKIKYNNKYYSELTEKEIRLFEGRDLCFYKYKIEDIVLIQKIRTITNNG